MEHEFDKIRNKVLEAEQNPVAWEKELVWSKIRQPERKHFVFYYAAASLLIASAIFFYAYESTKQKEIDLQLKAIELSIEKNKTYQASVEEKRLLAKSVVNPEPVVSQVIKQSGSSSRKMKRIKPAEANAPIITEHQQKPDVVDNTVAVIEPVVIAFPIAENNPEKKVQAIIGSSEQGPASTIKDKKIKFRLFLPEENTETVPAAAETISFHSRIK